MECQKQGYYPQAIYVWMREVTVVTEKVGETRASTWLVRASIE